MLGAIYLCATPEREKTRKMYVASLFARTPEQIAEEEGLYIEIKRLEQTERRFAKEREELMKTVAGIESGLNVHQPDEEAFSGLFIDPRRKKKKGDGMEAESPSSAGLSSTPVRRVITAKQAAEGGCYWFANSKPDSRLQTPCIALLVGRWYHLLRLLPRRHTFRHICGPPSCHTRKRVSRQR